MSDDGPEPDTGHPPTGGLVAKVGGLDGGHAELYQQADSATVTVEPILDPRADSALSLAVALDGVGEFSVLLTEKETRALMDALGDVLDSSECEEES